MRGILYTGKNSQSEDAVLKKTSPCVPRPGELCTSAGMARNQCLCSTGKTCSDLIINLPARWNLRKNHLNPATAQNVVN